jgi:phi13 family phage major tail protein
MGRVRFGFSKLHYAKATEGAGGALTYGTPAAIPGAKQMSLSPAGSTINEPADNTTWHTFNTNDGYTGTIEFEDTADADAFLTEVLGHTLDSAGGILEKADDTPVEFAILGQFELAGGTEVGKRVCFYRCVASRPNVDAQTTEQGSVTVATNVINVTALPRLNDAAVKYTAPSTASNYATWFDAVPEA